MNRKTWIIQLIALLAITAVVASAQSTVGTGAAPGIEAGLKWFARMLLGAFGWVSLIALIWHAVEWAFDRSAGHLGSMAKWAVCSGIGFSAYYVVSQLQAAAIAQIP